eukprot:Nk52_evm29s2612 gene=Nk52_evmTU29s2612
MFAAVNVMAVSKTASKQSKKRRASDTADSKVAKKEKIEITHSSHKKKAGYVWTCGEGDTGQLGNGEDVTTQKRPKPVEKIKSKKFMQVSCGGMHTLALSNEGKLYSWGVNDEFALGRLVGDESSSDPSIGPEAEPQIISKNVGNVKFVQVVCGDSHTMALSSTGDVWGWGVYRDQNGAMGFPSPDKSQMENCMKEPCIVFSKPKDPVVKISSGIDHTVALTKDGHLYSWGCGDVGQLGRVGERSISRRRLDTQLYPSQVPIKPKKHVKDVFAGGYMTFAILEDGNIVAWGLNNYAQLGVNTGEDSCIFSPQLIPSLQGKRVVEIACGQHFTLMRSSNGKVYSVGRGDYGQLGHGDDKSKEFPMLIKALEDKDATFITCGESVSFAQFGKVAYGWGFGVSNQTGNAVDDEDVTTPKPVVGKLLGDKGIIDVSAGGQHSAFIVDSV